MLTLNNPRLLLIFYRWLAFMIDKRKNVMEMCWHQVQVHCEPDWQQEQVQQQVHQQQQVQEQVMEPPLGALEALAARAQQSLHALWRRARSQAETTVQGIMTSFRRQEHDVLHAATVEFEHLGMDLDLNEAGDLVSDDLRDCARSTQVIQSEERTGERGAG